MFILHLLVYLWSRRESAASIFNGHDKWHNSILTTTLLAHSCSKQLTATKMVSGLLLLYTTQILVTMFINTRRGTQS
jgi:hypothetical protein